MCKNLARIYNNVYIPTKMKRFIPYILSLSAVITASCVKEDPNGIIQPDPEVTPKPDPKPEQQAAVSFSSIMQEEISSTRTGANTRAQEGLKKDFVVYGYKTMTDNSSPIVFDGYNVTYNANSSGTSEDNSHNYSYVGGTSINGFSQEIKYWDYSATEYRYWGYVKNDDKISPSDNGKTLTITGLQLGTTEQTDYFISSLRVVPTADFGKVVQLEFIRPYAKVRVMFYSGEKLEDDDTIELSKITFGPSDESKIPAQGTVKVVYPLDKSAKAETYTVTDVEASRKSCFDYSATAEAPLKLDKDHCSTSTAIAANPTGTGSSGEYYYVLPVSTGATPPSYTLSVSVDGDDELRTAVIPATFMNWKANYSYTYIFKILEGGLIFVDAKVEDWKPGGTGNDEWRNW